METNHVYVVDETAFSIQAVSPKETTGIDRCALAMARELVNENNTKVCFRADGCQSVTIAPDGRGKP